ncbi:MAG: hypothetical protein HY812_01160, partial [Planctomycetes bacterium]|nr:hypothetical protein [Planctomycetota bacterium]
GHVLEGVSLPNRRLCARPHSLPCAPCRALHCSRCVFQSKLATFEYCVPARNVCLRAHYELEVQASLARAAQEQGLWFDEWQAPEPPACYDPYELIVAAEKDGGDAWSILRLFTGGAQNLTPTMMLSLVHELHGHVHALADLLGAGQAPPAALHARSLLAQAQQRALYGYRDLRLREDCPTLGELLDETRALAERRAAAGQGHSWGGAVP